MNLFRILIAWSIKDFPCSQWHDLIWRQSQQGKNEIRPMMNTIHLLNLCFLPDYLEINLNRKYQATISYQSTYKNIFKSIELVKISTETHLYDVVVVSKNNVRCDVLLMLLKTLNQLRFLSTTVYRLSITRALVFERDKLLYCKYF